MTHEWQRTYRLKNELEEIRRIAAGLKRFGKQCSIAYEQVHDITLSLEELISNIIKYAYNDEEEHLIQIDFSFDGTQFSAVIIDDGKSFNPLEQTAPDLSASLEDRKIGGLGIFFARELMDSLDYKREKNLNRVTVKKTIKNAED